MAHELNHFTDGRARMAYVGATPWHGLGQALTVGAPLETWAREAGMDYQILDTPVQYRTADGKTFPFNKKRVLYREDTSDALAVVGNMYKVVQPIEVLEFFRNLTTDYGFELETAGVLFNGQKYWALARTGETAKIARKDELRGYVLLATSCDGSMKTTARHTSVRVVCSNTLELSNRDRANEVKISHSSKFKATEVQEQLGIIESGWKEFVDQADALSQVKLSDKQAVDFVIRLMGDPAKPVEAQSKVTDIGKVLQLYKGNGLGSTLKSAEDTAWGLVNAVTEMVDWHKGKDQQRRLESAWVYTGAQLKRQAFEQAINDFVLRQAA